MDSECKYAYQTLVDSGEATIEGLSKEPKALAVSLLSKGFISGGLLRQINELPVTSTDNAGKLYTAILGTVKHHPHKYKDFVSLLEGNSLLYGDLLDLLDMTYKKRAKEQSQHPLFHTLTSRIVVIPIFIVLLAVLGVLLYSNIHNIKLFHRSKTLPYLSENFVGRDKEMQELLEKVQFDQTEIRIINIIGSPGFGKSTLAINIGHSLIDQGVGVHYINMAEFPDEQVSQVLAEKILKSSDITAKAITFERMLRWARERYDYTLIILDNCDDILHTQKEQLQFTIKQIVEASTNVKILMTSREVTLQIEYFSWYKVYELSPKAALSLLNQKLQSKVEIDLQEKEAIADFTGNVPLALHIVGSLLMLPDPPTPASIVQELKTNPINLLSPKKLPVNMRISASINVSYQYLGANLRRAACFLAMFPGSFDKPSALGVYEEYQIHSHKYLELSLDKEVLSTLVDRSLLEFNQRTKRYQYHRLIREFFLERLREMGDSQRNMSTNFATGFRYYFTQRLHQHTVNFKTQYVDSLRFLDTERHNIYQLIEELKQPWSLKRHTFLTVVDAVVHATKQKFLTCRFTETELRTVIQIVLAYLDEKIEELQTRGKSKTVQDVQGIVWYQDEFYFRLYTRLVIVYADLTANNEGEENAIEVLNKRAQRVDFLSKRLSAMNTAKKKETIPDKKSNKQRSVSTGSSKQKLPTTVLYVGGNQDTLSVTTKTLYQQFYYNLGNYHLTQGQHPEVVKCHLKIMEGEIRKCDKECTYESLGHMYMITNNQKEAARHYELSLEHENILTINRAKMMVSLYEIYITRGWLWNTDEVEWTLTRLLKEHNSIMALPEHILFHNRDNVMKISTVLRKEGKKEEADGLENKLFQILSTTDTKFQLRPKDALKLLKKIGKSENYTKTIIWGTFLLSPFKHFGNLSTDDKRNVLEIRLVVSIAKIYTWQIFEGFKELEYIHKNIIKENKLQRQDLQDLHKEVCFYLIPRLWYIYECYGQRIFRALKMLLYDLPREGIHITLIIGPKVFSYELPVKIVYLTCVIPFDIFPGKISLYANKQDETVSPESKTKALSTSSSYALQLTDSILNFSSEKISEIKLYFFNMLKYLWYNIFQPILHSAIFRLIVGILLIWIRLWALLALLFMMICSVFIICLGFVLERMLASIYYKVILNPQASYFSVYCMVCVSQVAVSLLTTVSKLSENLFGYKWLCLYTQIVNSTFVHFNAEVIRHNPYKTLYIMNTCIVLTVAVIILVVFVLLYLASVVQIITNA